MMGPGDHWWLPSSSGRGKIWGLRPVGRWSPKVSLVLPRNRWAQVGLSWASPLTGLQACSQPGPGAWRAVSCTPSFPPGWHLSCWNGCGCRQAEACSSWHGNCTYRPCGCCLEGAKRGHLSQHQGCTCPTAAAHPNSQREDKAKGSGEETDRKLNVLLCAAAALGIWTWLYTAQLSEFPVFRQVWWQT